MQVPAEVAPRALLYEPGEHAVQTPSPKYPGRQRHPVLVSEAMEFDPHTAHAVASYPLEYKLVPLHTVHASEPSDELNVPGAHSEHTVDPEME